MSDYNKGEIGSIIRVNAGQDISSATSVLIMLEPEVGTIKEFVATVPAVQVTVDNVVYPANQYAEYTTILATDLDYSGKWRKKAAITFSSALVTQTNYVKFRVLP
jgi:hypothetical protein